MSPAPNAERRSGFISGLLVGAAAALAGVALVFQFTDRTVADGDDVAAQARQFIEDNYFKNPTDEQLAAGTIRGIIDELRKDYDDRFSHYFTPEQFDQFEQALSPNFSGVGLTIKQVKSGLEVTTVIPDSPAEEADLRIGDTVTAVDGESIKGVPTEVATAQIKGEDGTEVELTIAPAQGGPEEDIELERANVKLPAASGRIERAGGTKVAYVSFRQGFGPGSHGELRSEIERLYRNGAEGLVLDLRGNGGGRLDEAILAGSIFVEEGDIVTTRGRATGEEVYDAEGGALDPRPTVAIIDEGSASATEILAAALKDYDLATLVGEKSFGKGTVQDSVPLPDGSAINLTIAEYLTADGTSIAGKGVTPDVKAVDDPETKPDEALDRALEVLGQEVS